MRKIRETKASNYHRAKLLSLLGKYGSLTISKLAEYLEVSRPTVYLHIDTLRERGLVTTSKDIKVKGAPVTVSMTSKADPLKLELLEATWGKIRQQFQ